MENLKQSWRWHHQDQSSYVTLEGGISLLGGCPQQMPPGTGIPAPRIAFVFQPSQCPLRICIAEHAPQIAFVEVLLLLQAKRLLN